MEETEYHIMYELEEHYWWYRALRSLVASSVSKFKGKAGLSILDAGCGTGKTLEVLSSNGAVEGIDYSDLAVGYCHKRGISNVIVGDVNTFDFGVEKYDAIVSLDVLCHAGVDDDFSVMQKFYRALKKDGILILNLPAFPSLRRRHDRLVHIARRYTKRKTVSRLTEMGFSILIATYRLPFLFFPFLMKALLERKKKENEQSDLRPLPRILNRLLVLLMRGENFLLLKDFVFPIGTSLFVVVSKKNLR